MRQIGFGQAPWGPDEGVLVNVYQPALTDDVCVCAWWGGTVEGGDAPLRSI